MEKEIEKKEKDVKSMDGKGSKYVGKQRKTGRNAGQGTPMRNPWDLYASSDGIARDVASVPYNHISGTPFNWVKGLQTADLTAMLPHSQLPGVCVISYVPTPGGASIDATSSINMAARQLYSFVRRNNSGAKNYESPDLMLYILAMEDIYINFYEAKRCYGLMSNYQFMNRYTPDAILRGIGIDPVDLRSNLASYRYQLNQLALKINSLAVPKYFKSFIRRVVVASQIYCDSTSPRSGYYIYSKNGYYTFKPTLYTTGGCLQYTETSASTLVTLQSKLNIITSQIEAVIADDDMNTMMGDLIKAFGESGLYQVTEIPENYSVLPVYDENILAQIENSRSWSLLLSQVTSESGVTHAGLDVWQKDNVLYYHPIIDDGTAGTAIAYRAQLGKAIVPILNSHKDSPDYKDNLEWTRQMSVFSGKTFGDHYSLLDCGLEIITGYAYVAQKADNSGVHVIVSGSVLAHSDTTSKGDSTDTVLGILSAASQFDWHPFYYYSNESDDVWLGSLFCGDLKVFTQVDASVVARIHQCANYSVYYSPNLY